MKKINFQLKNLHLRLTTNDSQRDQDVNETYTHILNIEYIRTKV